MDFQTIHTLVSCMGGLVQDLLLGRTESNFVSDQIVERTQRVVQGPAWFPWWGPGAMPHAGVQGSEPLEAPGF